MLKDKISKSKYCPTKTLKSVLKLVIFQRKCPKIHHILKIVQFWSILLNSEGLLGHFFGNVTCLRTLFWGVLVWSFNFKSDICLSTCYIVKKWLKKLSDFKYCAIMTCSALFHKLIRAHKLFLWKYNMFKEIFGGLWV